MDKSPDSLHWSSVGFRDGGINYPMTKSGAVGKKTNAQWRFRLIPTLVWHPEECGELVEIPVEVTGHANRA